MERAKNKRKTDVAESEMTPRCKRQKLDINLCFLCEKGIEVGELHKVSTLDTKTNIKRMITELNDPNLLVKIVGTDLIAKGIRYHLKCLVELRNRYRSCNANLKEDDKKVDESVNNSRVFVELTSYIEREVNSGNKVFKLAELHSLYEYRFEDLGNKKSMNKTRLKKQLLEHFKEAQEQSDGKKHYFGFQRRDAEHA